MDQIKVGTACVRIVFRLLPRAMFRLLSSVRWWLNHRSRDDSPLSDCPEEDEPIDLFNPYPEPVQLEISDVIDLHTIAPRDVAVVVEEYLSEARRAGFRQVRIIHGKGKGVQRAVVCRILAETPFVEGWTDAPLEAGGWGATVVRMRWKDE